MANCWQEIKRFLRSPYSVGIIGGRPHHAIFFVGYKGDELLGLDPHSVFRNPPPCPTAADSGTLREYISQVGATTSPDLSCVDRCLSVYLLQ